MEILHSWTRVKFIAEIIAASVIALIAIYNQMLFGGDALNIAIISAVMPIVPGVLHNECDSRFIFRTIISWYI
ncbi:threonine/serine exporter family protein [Mammaliicoccus sciuri]|uniref:threonine/serine exporter family protein n=1 Tax=Mammaliicoccus sciuri TaxID=1296 RepID=UPI00397D18D3